MISQLDPTIIREFRSKVHENYDFVRIHFVDLNGKDVWSKICSCMDWLDVAVEGIELPKTHENMNVTSLELTHFIVTIDMVYESVKNLWTSFRQAKKVNYPFKNDYRIFSASEYGRKLTDDMYFKEIRAWFGVHSVNGNEKKLKEFAKPVRFFTSWSSTFDGTQFSLSLYSNNSRAEREYGGIKKIGLNQILNFIEIRYHSLYKLMNIIDELYSEEKKRLQRTTVKLNKNDTPLRQLQNLYEQSRDRRLTSEFYEDQIEMYISFLKCNLGEFNPEERGKVNNYLNDLRIIIPKYRKVIQDVEWYEDSVFDLLSLRSQIAVDHHYDLSKVLENAEHKDHTGAGNHTSYKISLEMLIDQSILPEYSRLLLGEELTLMIYALDHNWAKKQPKFQRQYKGNKFLDIVDDITDS